ncbi:MAG: YlmC/YmxH family sporulation protein [Oscillospiraceae bacterium]
MLISLSLLCQKDIISVITGQNIGRADDIEFDQETALLKNLVVFGRPKLFGLLGRGQDIKISWQEVVTVGRDVVLINTAEIKQSDKKGKLMVNFD